MDISERTLRALEWDKLVAHLALQCQTLIAQDELSQLSLTSDKSVVEQLLSETDEASTLINDPSLNSLSQLPDLREALNRLKARAPLTAHELLQVFKTLRLAKLVKSSLSLLPLDSYKQLPKYSKQLTCPSELLAAIDLAIDQHGQVKDDASSTLMDLRTQYRTLEAGLKEELRAMIHSVELSKSLQEPLYTQRGNRYVLPVMSHMRSSVPGLVHDSSASGLTLYIEPLSIVELSNKLRLKELAIEHEIICLLEDLSVVAHGHLTSIEQSMRAIVELDKIMARAHLGTKYDGTIPLLSQDNSFALLEARHPLLSLKSPKSPNQSAIGNDLIISNNQQSSGKPGTTLIITGPNTGGKTVLLKTFGLLSLMLRAGLMLPVKKGSKAKIFADIFADIGDEQSLEQSLSTFSAHMTNIVQIVQSAQKSSLVLLDEIGAGTDPKEGGALAQAIMEHLNSHGALTIVTTHLVELKTLAYMNSGFINASFEFDDKTLLPTYKLRIGVPGTSHATTIAERLGLSQSIVERTRLLLKGLEDNLQTSIKTLEANTKEALDRQNRASAAEEGAVALKGEYEAKLKALQSEANNQAQEYIVKIKSEFDSAKVLIAQLTAELQKQPSLPKADSARKQLESLKRDLGWIDSKPDKTIEPAAFLQRGQKMFIKSLNQFGILEEIPSDFAENRDAIVQLRVGNIKIKVPVSDLRGDDTGAFKAKERRTIDAQHHRSSISNSSSTRQASARISNKTSSTTDLFLRSDTNTLDLRSLRVEEALSKLAPFLNDAVLHEISPTMIIHGHGTGALKSAVRNELSNGHYPVEFRPGDTHEGGDGVTIVSL